MKKRAINTLTFILLVTLFAGCGKRATVENSPEETVQLSSLDVDALLDDAENLVGETITLEGVCTHICRHGGRKIFLMGSDDTKTIRIESGKVGKFNPDCVNNIVSVLGTVCEQRIDEAYLQEWEASIAEDLEVQHGEGEEGCSTEKKARSETGNSATERIADFRKRIEDRNANEGKPYLSFYYIEAEKYTVLD